MKSGVDMISSVMGPPGASGDPMDEKEDDEGGEGELETHIRAFFKAGQGNPRAAGEALRAAVNVIVGSTEE